LISIVSTGAILFFYPTHSFATPSDGLVVKGSATISQSGTSTLINQGSARAVIDWRGFDIGAGERVQFIQANQQAIALNRITGGNPTSILGQLAANGRVFISNPNGVIFGQGSKVDVAGLMTTTLSINADDFMSGKNTLNQGITSSSSSVVNQGDIRIADNGFCFLVAPSVQNSGTIIGQLGKVVLASAESMTLDFNGDGLITYTVSGKALDNIIGADGKPFASTVTNSGSIKNAGGEIVLVGNVESHNIFASVVNNSGLLEATSLVANGGSVSLSGGDVGVVQNTGRIDVSATEAGAATGHVAISGQFAGNFGTIAATGNTNANGGLVEFQSTTQTLLGSDSRINVSGKDNSSAGSVLIRSDNHSSFDGEVLARGGDNGGDGGFVDVSSKGQVDLWGTVDALAPSGKIGTLLIDPKNITVVSGVAGVLGSNLFTDTSSGDTTINNATINGAVSNVVLQANTDITVNTGANIGMIGSGIGLTMQAGRSVAVNANITTTNGAVSITANDSGATSSDRTAGAGSITMAAGTTINAGSGNITLKVDPLGATPGGITVASLTTTGDVTLTAAGGDIATAGTSLISGATVTLGIKSALDPLKDTDIAKYVQHNIGSSGSPIKTSATNLSATTEYGAIYIDETDAVTINNLTTKFKGVTANPDADGKIVATLADGTSTCSGLDINLLVSGDLTLGTTTGGTSVSTPNSAIITATAGKILDGNNAANNVVASSVTISGTAIGTPAVTGTGTEEKPQTPPDALELMVPAITSVTATTGNVYLASNSNTTLTMVNASGDIGISGSIGNLTLGALTAGGDDIIIKADGGKILSDTTSLLTAQRVALKARDGIGAKNKAIATSATTLGTEISGKDALTYVTSSNALKSVVAITKDSEVSITGSSSTKLLFTDNDNVLSAKAESDISFKNTDEGVVFGTIDAGTSGEVTLVASGTITAGTGSLTASKASFQATSLGASTAPMDIKISNLTATTTAGGIFLKHAQPGDFTLVATAAGSGNGISVTTGGKLLLKEISAPGAVTLTAGAGGIVDDNGNARNITATSATMNAAGAIGALDNALETAVTTLDITTSTGGVYLNNSKPLTLTASVAGDIELQNTGSLALNSVSAPNKSIALTVTGAITNNNAPSNITANHVTITSSSIGASDKHLKTAINTLNATTSSGGMYFDNTTPLSLTATAKGNGADISIDNGAADMALGIITATGDTVTLKTRGAINDGNGLTTSNISARVLSLDATTVDPALGLSVSEVVGNGTTPLTLTNDQPLALGASSLTGGGTFTAPAISILDLGNTSTEPTDIAKVNGTPDTVTSANSLTLKTTTGHIVFLDTQDTIVSNGSITVDAGINTNDSGAAAVIGNLKTSGGTITVSADSHISVGELNSGTSGGLVTVISRNGMILDNNGAADNIIAGSASLSAMTPSEYYAARYTSQNLSDASAAATAASLDTNTYNNAKATFAVYNTALNAANNASNEAKSEVDNKQTDFDKADKTASDAELAAQILTDTAAALGIVADAAELVSAGAQIIPLTGDGGGSMAFTILKVGVTLANMGALISSEIAADLRKTADGKEADLVYAINVFDNKGEMAAKALLDNNVWAELLSNDTKNMQQSLVTNAAAQLVKTQALTANPHIEIPSVVDGVPRLNDYYAPNAIGTQDQPFGVQVPGRVNITAGKSNVYLSATGDITLGDITASQHRLLGPSVVIVNGSGNVSVSGTVNATDLVRINTTNGAITEALNGSGKIVTQNFIANATTGIGNGSASPLLTNIDNFAASGGSGGVSINNDKALNITTITDFSNINEAAGTYGATTDPPLSGVTATGGTSAISTTRGNITVAKTVTTATGNGNIILTTADNMDINAPVTAGSNGNINLNASGLNKNITIGATTDISSVSGNINMNASNAVNLGRLVSTTGDVTISAASIIESANGVALDIAGTTINLFVTGATSSIGTAINPLEINAINLNASTSVNNHIWLDDLSGGVAVGSVNAGEGNVTINSIGGSITESGNDANPDIIGNTITLVATGDSSTIGSSSNLLDVNAITLNGRTDGNNIYISDTAGGVELGVVTTGNTTSGSITLEALNGSITRSGSDTRVDMLANTLNLSVTGGSSTIGTHINPLVIDAVNLNAQSAGNDITIIDNNGGVAVDLVSANSTTSGTVNLTAREGSIIESGSDVVADIIGETVNLVVSGAASTIGTSTNTLEIDAGTNTLNAQTKGGDVFLNDILGGVGIGTIDTGGKNGGNLNLTATNGNIANSAANGSMNIMANNTTLAATGTGAIGTTNNPLELTGTLLTASTNGGNINLHDVGGIAIQQVNAGGVTGGIINFGVSDGSLIKSPTSTVAQLVGSQVNLAVDGLANSAIGEPNTMLKIDASQMSVDNPRGKTFVDMNRTAITFLNSELPSGMYTYTDKSGLPEIIVSGHQVLGGNRIDTLQGAIADMAAFQLFSGKEVGFLAQQGESALQIEGDSDKLELSGNQIQ